MFSLLTVMGAEGGGISSLGINVSGFIIQLATFLLAYLILRKWAFKPIIKMLKDRRETIEKGVTLGEKMQNEEAKMEQKVAEALASARKEADGIIADASDRGRQVIAEAEAKAKEKADQILASAEDKIKREQARLRKELESEVAGLVTDATEVIIDEKLDDKKDAALIDRALKGGAK